ncbi:MAG: tetratricopeptide repeat protein [Planctomycetaceae bacterium]
MERGRFRLFLSFGAVAPVLAILAAAAARAGAPAEPKPMETPAPRALAPQQFGDEPIEPFEPLQPLPADDKMHRAARAWYMTGKVYEARADSDQSALEHAVAAYRKAVELDPGALKIYEALIPVLYAQNQKPEARKFALQAAGQTNAGLRLVRGLAAVMARGDSLQDAAAMLREAVALPHFDPQDLTGLLVHRDLGMYLHLSEQPGEAAKSYQLVFAALQPERMPPLTEAQRHELLGDAGKLYDEFGKTFLDAKLPDLAVQAFSEAAKFNTGRPGIHSYNLALVYRETGKPEQALSELEQYFAAQLQSKGRDAYQLLKDLLADLNRSDELLPRLETLHQQDSRNAFLAYFLGDEYLSREQFDKAQALFEQTLGASSDPRGLVGLIPVYRRQHKFAELVDVLGKVYPQIPEDRSAEDLQKLLPDARVIVQRYETEIDALGKDAETLDGLMQIGRQREKANPPIELAQAYMLGKLAVSAKRTDDAVFFYRLTMSMLNQPMLNVYRELGEYLIDQKKYADAAQVFREATEKPEFEQARWVLLYFLTYPLEFGGKTDEALQAITEARGSQPDNPQLHFQHAWILYHAQRWNDAEPILKEIVGRYKGDADSEKIVRQSQFSLSNLYVQRGEVERGEEVLQDVLKEIPDNPQANNDLGYLWADKNKNLDQARGMIEKALAAEPTNPAYLDSMGWVLYRLEQFADARTHLEKATQQEGGDDSTIFDHLGDVLIKLDLKEDAAKAWRKALEIEHGKSRPDEHVLKRITEKLPAESTTPPPPSGERIEIRDPLNRITPC